MFGLSKQEREEKKKEADRRYNQECLAVRVQEAHRWLSEFDAFLEPMWRFIRRNELDLQTARDQMRALFREMETKATQDWCKGCVTNGTNTPNTKTADVPPYEKKPWQPTNEIRFQERQERGSNQLVLQQRWIGWLAEANAMGSQWRDVGTVQASASWKEENKPTTNVCFDPSLLKGGNQ